MDEMWRLLALMLLLGIASKSAADTRGMVRCKAVGSWGCNNEFICVDGPAHRGEKYRIYFDRMIVRGPLGASSMQPAIRADGRDEWTFAGGGRLISQGRLEHPRDEKRDYDTYWLFYADAPRSPIELWCDVKSSNGS
jgi:hypothetical protein